MKVTRLRNPRFIDFRTVANPHGLRFIEGDGGNSGGAGEGGDGGDGGDGAGDDAPGGDGDKDGDDGDGKDDGDGPWADPEKAKAEITRLRRENAKQRVDPKEAAQQARTALLGELAPALKALGVEVPGESEEVTAEQLSTAQAAHRDTAAELVVWRNVDALKVDAKALTDSRAFARAIASLDPTSDTFENDVKKAAQEAATNNPKLKAAPVVGASAADHAGGSGEGSTRTPKSLTDAVAGAYSG